MKIYVIKRDGRKVLFKKDLILNAITAAGKEIYTDDEKSLNRFLVVANYMTDDIVLSIKRKLTEKDDNSIDVEEIQDIVENELLESDYPKVAQAYIRYRQKRTDERQKASEIFQIIKEKIEASNVVNQNANVDEHSFGGRAGEAKNAVLKDYALRYCMSPMSRNNHENNEIYIHDLDSYAVGMHNCLSIPFDDLLAKGFNTRQTDVRPAKSVNTAMQLVAVISQLQSLVEFGGVAATHLDWTMVPYVRLSFNKHFIDGIKYLYDGKFTNWSEDSIREVFIDSPKYKEYPKAYKYAMDMTNKETYQAVEGLYHNLNTLQSRSGNQLPFTSINYGTCTLPEGRMVIKALLDVSIKGIGKLHRTPIFPCGIFQYMKGVNDKPGTPNYDLFRLALKSTSKRLYPNYCNVDWSGNKGYDRNDPRTYTATMG